MPLASNPKILGKLCLSEDAKNEIEPIFTEKYFWYTSLAHKMENIDTFWRTET